MSPSMSVSVSASSSRPSVTSGPWGTLSACARSSSTQPMRLESGVPS